MGLTAPSVLHEHFAAQHHLDVTIFLGMLNVDREVCAHSREHLLNVLCVCFELVGADSVVDLGEVLRGVVRRCFVTLTDEELF